MRAVCNGDSSCQYSSARCQVVDFEDSCGNPMYGLSRKLCSGKRPNQCPQMDGLFTYRKYRGGECGVVSEKWCVAGNGYTSGNGKTYYAYCIKQ